MLKILVVNDEAHILRVIKKDLERRGFRVNTAISGDVALPLLLSDHYDAVIVDQEMPGMSGRRLCEAAERDLGADMPLIVLTVDSDDQELVEWSGAFSKVEVMCSPISLGCIEVRLREQFNVDVNLNLLQDGSG